MRFLSSLPFLCCCLLLNYHPLRPSLPQFIPPMESQRPRRQPSINGSDEEGTLAEQGTGHEARLEKPRPDGKIELTERDAYEKLGFCFP